MAKTEKEDGELLDTAMKAMGNAYVLWGYRVGAAVLAEDGQIYGGCNVESWISGLGICAERCAINHAIIHGNRRIEKIAVIIDSENNADPKPCGACLQYIHDFARNSKIKIVTAKADKGRISIKTVNVKTLEEMLPFRFRK